MFDPPDPYPASDAIIAPKSPREIFRGLEGLPTARSASL
jgi:hypothetical protein